MHEHTLQTSVRAADVDLISALLPAHADLICQPLEDQNATSVIADHVYSIVSAEFDFDEDAWQTVLSVQDRTVRHMSGAVAKHCRLEH